MSIEAPLEFPVGTLSLHYSEDEIVVLDDAGQRYEHCRCGQLIREDLLAHHLMTHPEYNR